MFLQILRVTEGCERRGKDLDWCKSREGEELKGEEIGTAAAPEVFIPWRPLTAAPT